jgi:hypothetical protein
MFIIVICCYFSPPKVRCKQMHCGWQWLFNYIQLVDKLATSLLRTHLVDNFLQGCWAQQTCYKLFQQLVIVLQFNNLSISCKWRPYSNLIKYQHCYNLLTSLLQACCEHILLTSWNIFTCVYSLLEIPSLCTNLPLPFDHSFLSFP